MIGVGRGLRALADHGVIPWALVGGIYVGIGAGLAVASLVYFVSPPPPLPTRSDVAPTLATRGGPIGVLISNLGTPDAPTTPAVRRYLREFLSDERVVEVNRWLWAFVLNVIILPRRAAASARAYSVVWDEKTGSPLLHWSRQTSTALARELGDDYVVSLGMRYGAPSLETALEELVTARCRTIIVLPLYPQYSNPTTGTNNAKVMELVMARREQPTVSFVPPYPDDALYVAALADRVHEAMGDRPPDHYVFSFHGLPEAYVRASDPYVEQCACTAWALASALELERDQWEMVFQSRFGDEPWLQPFLDEYVPELASSTPRILVTMPGFAADCLETLEEVGVRLRERFAAAGGEELIVVPALNDHPVWIESLAGLVRETRAQHAYR
ncbi:MAG: ferrochelatase [Planctomycetes bacterium]|nr:ferrochelatase [Planctomycetota bacterium]